MASREFSLLTSIYCVLHSMCYTVYKNSTKLDVELFENLKLELRRGCLIVAVLAQLKQEHYGYTLRKALDDLGMAIDEGTLYPLLRRLETQGLLASEWREENKRNKRFYRLSRQGELILQQLLHEWQTINASLDRILQEA
ncbi:MAG TPA: helix-turn-helix transcriptional regulator [Blattabacteriaceae bacterium]|nr:helix-turn-helix transcriptional regulator [Blattabacteriaceae bacterium]